MRLVILMKKVGIKTYCYKLVQQIELAKTIRQILDREQPQRGKRKQSKGNLHLAASKQASRNAGASAPYTQQATKKAL